jgi:hypothetical protein
MFLAFLAKIGNEKKNCKNYDLVLITSTSSSSIPFVELSTEE